MKKDIKDYLHLYLGCECMTEDGRRGRFSGFDVVEKNYSIVMITVRFSDDPLDHDWTVLNDNEECDRIKLILRPLSDMTEDEKTEEYKIGLDPGIEEQFRWLLSKGFDLFGLIEAGLAIDKTTLKQTV